jgi:serine/threonine protein kinase
VIHRDVKLENLLLTSKRVGQAGLKLGDVGLSKLHAAGKAEREVFYRL